MVAEIYICRSAFETLSKKRVIADPLVGDGILDHILQIAQIPDSGIVGAMG